MIEIKNLRAGYGRPDAFIPAVDDISLTIGDNEIIGIAGESGSGKSTLLRTIYGDFTGGLKLRDGSVTGHFKDPETGRPLVCESSTFQKLWWDVISYVPQGSMSVLNPIMKIEKQVTDGLPAREKRGSRQELRSRLASFLAGFGLPETVLDSYPHQLSGGMRQRVLVAIAAFVNPQLILADEPTTALDVVVQKRILLMLVEIQRRLKNTLVLVSHDLGVHYQITDRIAIAYKGKIVEVGPTDEVFSNPQHDYTKALIAALPRIGQPRQETARGAVGVIV
ncbi:ABC transporter ATP-binding protein [Kaistia dalseonensis]|uniref:Peptide/nickel transport system ATP-binding protein n=1 Tax=Kaistia dalseonensis TaxID=410840 RepID=A0ABU0H9G1_9HYPH|nr:ABC transporter ATP-binding protein [Kaistia dalseonensis]MCX5495509.1 ABC transporter ATP-binding protein [Kaistia dalseonensis]MDQ0438101.1 peptide/nickel transport system ATP-binding protein [Kaistia dalseonensis]